MITGSLQSAMTSRGAIKLAVLYDASDAGWVATATDGRGQSRNGYGESLEEAVTQALDAIEMMHAGESLLASKGGR